MTIWNRLDCPPEQRMSRGKIIPFYCWLKDLRTENFVAPMCANGCNQPAEYDSPDNLCEDCWNKWMEAEST